MEFVSRFFAERMARDQCGLSGYANYDSLGNLMDVRVTSTGSCTAVVSMPRAAFSTSGADGVEDHGLDSTYRMGMTPGAARTLSIGQVQPVITTSTSQVEPTTGESTAQPEPTTDVSSAEPTTDEYSAEPTVDEPLVQDETVTEEPY